jgi:two-component system sensor histidine kinase RegB
MDVNATRAEGPVQLDDTLPVAPMATTIGTPVLLNAFVSIRLKRAVVVAHREMALHLAIDLAALTALLYLAGGAENPFSLLCVLHVTLIALLLPWNLAAAGPALVLACRWLVERDDLPLLQVDGSAVSSGLAT